MAEINNDEKRIGVSGEQIEEAVGKVPTIEADVKSNKQNISSLQADVSKHTADIARNTADIALKANADAVYSKDETDSAITAKVAEIVAGAPEEFDTLKEMSDWLTEHSDSAATMNTAIQANTKAIADNATAIEENTADIEQNKTDILLRIPRTYGAASSNNTNHYNKWYKLGRFETVTTNNTFNSIFLVHDRKGRENGLLTITIEKATSGGIVSAFASTIKAEWISAEYQTSSNYRKENNFVIVAWVEGTKLICELWCRIYEAWGCYHALKLVDNRMTQDISSVSYGSETGWVMEKTSTPYDNHPEASDTVRVVYSVDRLAVALRTITINNSKDNPIGFNTEIVLTRPYTDFNVLTITLNTSASNDTSTRHIIDIPVQGITYASRYMIVCGSETGTVRFDKSGTGNIKMISSTFEELYVISVDGRK